MQLNWLLNYWEGVDFDENVTIGEAMVAYAIYLSRLDLQRPASGASKTKVQAWKDAVNWVISDDDHAPLSFAKAAPVLRIDAETLRANLLREAGLPQRDRRDHCIVATEKSATAIFRSAFRRRQDRTSEHNEEVAAAMLRAGLQQTSAVSRTLTTKLRTYKARTKVLAARGLLVFSAISDGTQS